MKTVTNYLKNVTKSVIYAAADVGNDMMPNVGEFANSNKEFLKATYATLRNPKATVKKSIATIQGSKIYQAIDYGAKNAFEDLRTGNFYNKEREERDSLKLSGLGDENEWGDLSEFGIDDDWESSLNKTSKKDEITTGDLEIINAVEGSSAAGAAATVNAVIKSSEYQVKAARTNTANIYMQNEKLFGGLHQDLSVIGATMDSIHKITSAALQNIDKNTSDFFTAELKLSQERNAMLKEILEMQRNVYTSAIDKEKEEKNKRDAKTKKNRWKDVQFNGIADIDSYFEVIKGNVNNAIQSLGIPAFNEDSNMLATIMISPFKGMMQAIVKGVIPVTVKAASKELDETISGVFGHLIARMANAKNGEGGILGLISKVFGINTRVNSSIDTSRYEKGPIPFDGITRKAITDVIPTYLRRIEAHLTGKPEQTFNYESGKWVTMQSIKKDYGNIRKNAVRNANNNLRELMDPAMKRVRATNVRDAESWDKAYEEFQQYMYDNNGIFNPKVSAEKNNISASKYPNFYKHYNQIKNLFINSDYTEVQTRGGMKKFHSKYSKKINISKDVLEAKDIEERKYRDLESAIGGITQVVSAMGIDSHGKWDKDYKKFNIKESILYTKDSIGNTVFDYLRNINQELTWWRTYGYEDLYGTLINSNFQGRGRRGSRRPRNNRPDPNDFTYQQYSNRRRTTHTENFNKISLEHRDHKTERERYQQQISQYNESTRQKAIKAITSGDAMDLAYLDDEQAGNYIKALIGLLAEDNSEAYVNELGGYNTDIAGYIDKNFIKTGAKSLKDIRIIAEKKAKEQEEKEKEDKEEKKKTFLDTLVGKVKETGTFTGGIVGATGEVVSNLLMSADKAIYEMMYKSEIEDEDHEKYHGFMDMMQHKLTGTFDKIKEYVKGNVLDPFKKWLGIDKDGEITKRFTDELKNIGKNIWGTFVDANKDVWGPLFTDVGIKKGGQTSAEKNRAKERKKHLTNMEDVRDLTSIYDRNFVRLMSEYGLNFIDYGTNFEKAKEDLEKKVKEYYIKATNDMKEVTNKEEARTALDYATSLEDKQLEEIAKNLGINIENMKRTEILDAITNYTKTDKEFNSRLSRNAAIEAGHNLDLSTGDVINNATSASTKEKTRHNQSKAAQAKVNSSTLINPNAATRGIRNAINSGIKYKIIEDEFGNREMVIEHMSDKAIRRAITQQNKRNARRHKYTTKNGAVIDHGEFGPGKNALNTLKAELQRKQKVREKSIQEEGVEYKQKGSRDIRNWALSAGPEERASYCVANGFNGTPEEKERILIGLGVSKEQLIGARKAENYDDALNKMWLRYNVGMYAKGTNGVFATGPALLSRGEYVIDKTTGRTGIVNKTDLYNLGDSGTAIMRNPNSGTTIRGDSDKERLVGKKYGIPGYADGTVDSKVDEVTVNGNKLSAKSILDETKKNLPEGAAGGLIGGLLLSLVGLPLTGMVIGAGSSIIKHSDKLSEQLFGKKNEKGERDDSGAIKKSVVDAAKKYAPDMFKYGLAGIIPSLLVGLGPIPGLLVGSTIGFLRNNENFTNRYFGENGKFSIKSKEKQILQDLAPGAAKGALGGVLAHALLIPKLLPGLSLGGLGLVGSLLIGSGIGMAMSTEEFKNAVLGIPDKDGNREGGLLGAVKDSFAPLADAAVEFKDKLLTTLDKNIMEPLSQFAQPFIHELPRIAGWLPSKINDILENHFGRSLSGLFKDFIGNPIAGIVSKVAAPLANTALNIVTSPVKLFGLAGKKIRKNQIKENRADYMTAKERIEWSMENNGQVSSFDKAMAGIGSGVEGSLSLDQAKNLRDTLNTLNDTKASLALNKRKTKGDINNILDSIKGANGEELSKADKKNVRKALQAGNVSAAKQILMQNNFTESMLNNIFSDQGMGLDRKMKNYIDINAREKALGNISEGDKNSAKDSANTILKKLGIDNINLNDSKSVDRLLANLNTEIEDREINGNENVIEPIEKVGLTAEKIDESIKMINKTIIDLYTGNTESLKATEAKVKADLDAANAKNQEDINKRKDQYTDLIGRTKYTEQENDLINKIKEDNKDGSAKTENEIEDIIKEHTLGSMYQIKRDKNGNVVRDKNGKIEIERHGSKSQQEKIIKDLALQHMYQVKKDENGNIIRDNEGNLQIMKDEKGKLLINEDNKNAIDYATAEDNKSIFQRFSENTFDTLVNGTVETVGNVGAGALGAVGNILSGTAKGTAGVINAGTNLVGGLVGLIPTRFTRNAGRLIKEAGNAVYQSAENVNKNTSDFIDDKQKDWSNLLRKGRVGFNKVLRKKIGSPELNGVTKMNEKFGSFISKLVNEDTKKAQNLSRLYEIDAWYKVNEDSARIIMNLSDEQWKNICKFLKNKDVIDFIKASRKHKFPLYETSRYPNNMQYLTSLSPAELVKLKNCCSYNIRIFADKDYGRKSISDDFGNSFKNVYEKTTIEMKKKEAEKKKQKDVDEATNNPTPPESQPVPPTPDTDDITAAAGGTIPGYGIGTAILSGIADIGGMAFQGAKIVGRGLWEGTKAVGKLTWNGAKAVGKAAWNGAKALGKKAAGAAWNGAKAVGGKINDATGGVLKKAIDGAGKVGSNIFNGIKDTAGKLKKVDKIGPGPNDYGIIKEKSDGSFEPDTSDSKTKEIIDRATKAEKEENEATQAQIKMQEQMNKITAEPTKKEPGLLAKLLGGVLKFTMLAPFIKPLINNILKPLWEYAIKPAWNDYIAPAFKTIMNEVIEPGFDWLLNTGFPWIVQNILSPLGKIIVDAVHNKIADDWGIITHQSEASNYADPETGFTEAEKESGAKGEYTDDMMKKQYLNRITSAMSSVYTSGTSSYDSRFTLIQTSMRRIREAYKDGGISSTEIAEYIKQYQQNDYKGNLDELPTIIDGIIRGDNDSINKFAQAMDSSITNKDVAKNTSNARGLTSYAASITPTAALFGPIGGLVAGALTYNAVDDSRWKDSGKITGEFKRDDELLTDLTNGSSAAEEDVNASTNTDAGSGSGSNKPLSRYGRLKESMYGMGDNVFDRIIHHIQNKKANERIEGLQKRIEEKTGKSIDQVYEEYGLPKDDVYSNRRKSIGLNYGSFNPQNLAQVNVPTNDNIDSTLETIEKAKAGTVSIFSSNYWSNNDGNNVIASAYNNAMKIMAIPSIIIRDCMRSFLGDVSNISNKFTNSGSGSTSSSNLSSMFDSSAGIQFNFASPDNSLSTRLKSDSTNGSTDANNNDTTKDTNKDSSKDTKKDSSSNSKKTTSGKGKYGLGLYSKQIDPSISKIRFNANGDSEYQTIGDSGCGPAAAVNAIESMHGRSKNVVNAANFAIKGGYKERNGGTKPKFFSDYFASKGYGSQTTSNRNTLISNIKAGVPTVLMGQDKHGVSSSTPYGRNPHYVTATGVDSKGHVIIQDPESRYDNQLYSMSDVMKKTSFGVSAFGRGVFSRGHTRAQIKGIKSPTKFKYKFGTGLKYEKIAKQDLGKFSKLTAADMNKAIKEWNSSSPFNGHGDIFIEASEKTGLDPRYILAHAAWESGWGTSAICQDKGNYFGIGAFDNSAYESAYTFDSEGGSKMRGGIIGGAQWIKKNYYDEGQKSLYLMIYGEKQYASAADDWINGISSIMNGCPENTDASLIGSEYDVTSESSSSSTTTSSSSGSTSSGSTSSGSPGIFDWLKNTLNNSRAGMVFNSILGNNSSSGQGGNGIKPLSKYGRGEEIVPKIWKYLRDNGFTEAGAAGVLGNMECESGFNLGAAGDGGTSFGLCQWHNSRGDAMKKVAGDNWDSNLKGQLDYFISELKSSYPNLYKTLTTTNSVKEAASQMVDKFEVCEGHETSSVQNYRSNKANKWFTQLTGKEGEAISDTSSSSSSSTTTSSSSGSTSSGSTSSGSPGIFDWLRSVLNNSRVGMVFNSLIGSSSSSSYDGSSGSTSINTNGALNTSGNAQAVVENALNEIGYVADPVGTKHNKYNAWWNSGNYNGEEKGISAADGPAVDWCANFVSWIMRHSGVDESVAPNFACVDYDLYINHGAKAVKGSELLPGDVLFENKGQHTGIVVGYKDGKVYTVEGNGRYDGGNYDGTTVDFKTTQSPNDYYARPNYTTDGSGLNVDQIIKTGQEREDAMDSGKGGNAYKPLSKYGRFKNSLTTGTSQKRSYQEIHNEVYQLRKNDYNHTQLMKKESVYGRGTISTDNSALINTIIKILYTIADNTDKLNTIVSILNDKLGVNISASDINSKTNKATLKQKLMSSLSPSMITSTSKLNDYADAADSNGINNIIKTMNLIASE